MTKHFYRDMDTLHEDILSLSALVEEMIDNAAKALRERDVQLAREVAATDEQVDQREVRIEEFCLKVLALHQPVAVELRRVATVMKVNNDLERIADLAVNVAERAASLSRYPAFAIPADLRQMVDSNSIEPALHCFSAARHVERIADHATNIAEDVIYLVEGDIVRHAHSAEPDAGHSAVHANTNGLKD